MAIKLNILPNNSCRDHPHSGEEHRNRHQATNASRSHHHPPSHMTCHLSGEADNGYYNPAGLQPNLTRGYRSLIFR